MLINKGEVESQETNLNITNSSIMVCRLLLLPIIMLILAFFKMPYFFYSYLRIIIFLFSGYCFWLEWKRYKNIYLLLNFLAVFLLFNPFSPLQFAKQIWFYIDLEALVLFLFFIYTNIDSDEKRDAFPFNCIDFIKENGLGLLGFIALCVVGVYIKSGGRLFLTQAEILKLDRQDYQQAIKDGDLCSPEDVKNDVYTAGCRVMTFDDYLEDKEQKEDEQAEMESDSQF